MNLYKLIQIDNNDYDTFDSAIVIAPSEEVAVLVHPRHGLLSENDPLWDENYSSWVHHSNVTATLIGIADPSFGTEPYVILASFNAG